MKLFSKLLSFFLASVLLLAALSSCGFFALPADRLAEETESPALTGEVRVHYIDVGQGDSILIQSGSKAMLVDAGEREYGKEVLSYLRSLGVERLDFVVATHPHSDHIGGLPAVLEQIPADAIIMPNAVSATKTFQDLMDAVEDLDIPTVEALPGKEFTLGEASFVILAPNKSDAKNLNNNSVVIRLTFGANAFLFMGDAESASEKELLQTGRDLSADVLKVGHHGSDTSSTLRFLQAVGAKYAVICAGENNSYGHPKSAVLDNLAGLGMTVFRTDRDGTVVCVSDGETVRFLTH